jgi:hypothetical protein
MAHTVFTDTVFINGEETRFDVPSMVANDRTLMPIRMLAFAIGIEDDGIDWDPSGIVDLWRRPSGSTANNNQNQTAENPFANVGTGQTGETPGAAAGNPAIISASVGRINHDQGTPILILVETNRAADRVRVTDFDGAVLSELTEFEEDFQGRYFRISVTPEEAGEITLRVQAGNANGYSIGASNIMVNVIPETPPHTIVISNLRLARTRVDFRDTGADRDLIEGTVRTSTDVIRITIVDSDGRQQERVNRPLDTFTAFLTWDFGFTADNRNGEHTYTIVAVDRDGNEEELDFNITVVGGQNVGNQNNNNQNNDNRIISVNIEGGNRLSLWQSHSITIITNDAISEVEINSHQNRNNGQQMGGTTSSWNAPSNRLEWSFSFSAEESNANNYWIHVRDGNTWHSRQLNSSGLASGLIID